MVSEMDLDNLLRSFCPNGVKTVSLDDIATDVYRGSGIRKDQVTMNGTPCIRYGEIYTSYGIWFEKCISFVDEDILDTKKYFEHGDILFAITGESIEDIAKCTAYVGHDKCLAGGDIVVLKHRQNPKYLSYALSTNDAIAQKTKGKVKSKVVHSSVPSILKIQIPLPPIEVQNEIVRILDSFTALTAELTAELNARKRQYKFYRDKLLSFDSLSSEERERAGVKWMALGEFCSITRGKGLQKKDFVEQGVECVHYGQIYTQFDTTLYSTITSVSSECASKSKTVNPTDIIVAITSENEDDVCKAIAWMGNHDIVTGGHTAILKHEQNAEYLSYIFQTKHFTDQKRRLIHGTKVIEMSPSDLEKIVVPIPSIEYQKNLVSVLNSFRRLCTDISEGIPAEIEARRKQYEYYRDQLLSFKEAPA